MIFIDMATIPNEGVSRIFLDDKYHSGWFSYYPCVLFFVEKKGMLACEALYCLARLE